MRHMKGPASDACGADPTTEYVDDPSLVDCDRCIHAIVGTGGGRPEPGPPAAELFAPSPGSGVKVYVASGVENAVLAFWYGKKLESLGFEWTYDWTERALRRDVDPASEEELREIGEAELDGVCRADVVIVVLPGGAGTHTELGFALALGKRVVLVAGDRPLAACPFYFHPAVIRVRTADEAFAAALPGAGPRPVRGPGSSSHVYVPENVEAVDICCPPGGPPVSVHALGTVMRLEPGAYMVLAADVRKTAERIARMLVSSRAPAGTVIA